MKNIVLKLTLVSFLISCNYNGEEVGRYQSTNDGSILDTKTGFLYGVSGSGSVYNLDVINGKFIEKKCDIKYKPNENYQNKREEKVEYNDIDDGPSF